MLVSGLQNIVPAAAAAVLAASAVSGSCSSCSFCGRHSGHIAWAGGLVSEFSGLYLLLLTIYILIFAYRVCSGTLPVLSRADASYCCSSPAIG